MASAQHGPSVVWRHFMAASGACLGLVACTGQIGDSLAGGPGGDSTSSGSTGTGASSGSAAGGGGTSPPSDGAGGTAIPPLTMTIGQGVIRRLTRTEYNNTVRDLFGSRLTPGDEFPGDIGADGFDKASAPQTVVASHLAAFESGSAKVVDAVFADAVQRGRLVSCNLATGNACIRSTLETFLPRAWRRPVEPAEVDRLMSLAATEAQAGGSAEEQLKLALRGALTSVHFMYLVERDPDPVSAVTHRLNDYELASRLSYFLWSSMPDDKLLGAASKGLLQDDAMLTAEVSRMLVDPKAGAMADVFAVQWLQLSRLASHQPSADLFPGITDQLKLSMAEETRLFFQDMLQNSGPVRSLLGADSTFINPALATHYGLVAPPGTGFTKVSVQGTNRLGGVLGHASILMPTSGLRATSAVKRGEWVLDNMLCAAAPPPPPDVMKQLQDSQQMLEALANQLTARQFLEQHRAKPACAVCHSLIDPVGLGLENYDPVGRYRTTDKGMAIDPSGQLADGPMFKTAGELATALSSDVRLAHCFAEKLFTFALGRAPGNEDAPHVERLATANDNTLTSVLTRLVASLPFRARRGGDVMPGAAPQGGGI